MSCEQVSDLLFENLEGRLDDATAATLHEHLASCADCRGEAAELGEMWSGLGKIEPERASADMRSRFYEMLSAYERGEEGRRRPVRFSEWLRGWWPQQPVWQAGVAAATLLVGLWAGPRLLPLPPDRSEIVELRADMRSMTRTVALSLLGHQSASERLRAVGLSQQAAMDADMARALLHTIDEDPSVNVRLAALDVLAEMVQRPDVRSGLLESFPRQETPTMQVAMADVLSAMEGPRSRQAIQDVIRRDELPESVRTYLEKSLSEKGDEI